MTTFRQAISDDVRAMLRRQQLAAELAAKPAAPAKPLTKLQQAQALCRQARAAAGHGPCILKEFEHAGQPVCRCEFAVARAPAASAEDVAKMATGVASVYSFGDWVRVAGGGSL